MTARFWVDVPAEGAMAVFYTEKGDLVYRKSGLGGYEWWNPTAQRFVTPNLDIKADELQAFLGDMVRGCVGKDFVLCVRPGLEFVGIFHREGLHNIRRHDLELGEEFLVDLRRFLMLREVMES